MTRRAWLCANSVIALIALPVVARGQQGPLTQKEIAGYIAANVPRERILEMSRDRCLSFVIAAQTTRPLLAESGDSALISGLREACYVGTGVEVIADRPGTQVRLDDQRVGVAPWTGPVPPAGHITVEVQQGSWSQRVLVDLRPDQFLRVSFHAPVDTAAVPNGPSDADLQRMAGDTAAFAPRVPRPTLPEVPVKHSGFGSSLLGALIGGAVAAGVGTAACHTTTPTYTLNSNGINVPTGTTRQINGGCVAASAGAGVLAGVLVGGLLGHSHATAITRAYDQARANYPILLARWQQQNLVDSAAQVADAKQRYYAAQAEAERVRAAVQANASARAHNAQLRGPDVTIEPVRRLPHALPNAEVPR